MGSGKSFFGTRKVIEIIEQHERPVFTNLPIRWKVIKRYLANRRGHEYSNLIYPLTQSHFRRYIDRQHRFAEDRTAAKLQCDLTGQRFNQDRFEQQWFKDNGPHIVQGDQDNDIANWIYDGAYIIIDEAHHWFPMSSQKADTDLQKYLTMLRHHGHQAWFMTQQEMQLNIAARRLLTFVWLVERMDDYRLAWGIRFKHFGLKAIGYKKFTADQWDGKSREDAQGMSPIDRDTVILNMPWERWTFRLYDSFAHAAGLRRLLRIIRETRTKCGVQAAHDRYQILLAEHKRNQEMRFIRSIGKWSIRIMVVGIVASIGYAVGAAAPRSELPPTIEISDNTPDPQTPAPIGVGRRLIMIAGNSGVLDGAKRLRQGQQFEGATVQAVDSRGIMLERDGVLYLWTIGDAGAIPLGSANQLNARHRAHLARDGLVFGSTVPTQQQPPTRAVGAP